MQQTCDQLFSSRLILAALKGETVASATPLWKLVNPYHGLEAMSETNADYFYGRNLETAAVLNALASKPGRCPILIGASGVGKSSVAQASVLSGLKSMRWPGTDGSAASWPKELQNSRTWVSLTMRPGEAPLEALTAAITRLWQLDAKDPDQAALPRKWAKGRSSRQSCIGWRQHRVPAEFRCSALGRSWHLCDIAKSRMDVRFRGVISTDRRNTF